MEFYFVLFCACVVYVQAKPVDLPNLGIAEVCGKEASNNPIHRNPWLVYFDYYNRGGSKQKTRCAGTLIDDRHVVTAAHCVRPSLYTRLVARLGEYNVSSAQDCYDGVCAAPAVTLDIVDVKVPSTYDGRTDDIAVLTLAEPVSFTDFIQPICVPTGSVDKGTTFTATGWGELIDTHMYSDVKKILTLPFVSEKDCKKAYSHLHLAEKIICAGGEEGIDTCRGDSGAPLTLKREERVEFWGVTSSGNAHCGAEGTPGMYTNVKAHLDWIHEQISEKA